jgi:hypothetical protein
MHAFVEAEARASTEAVEASERLVAEKLSETKQALNEDQPTCTYPLHSMFNEVIIK